MRFFHAEGQRSRKNARKLSLVRLLWRRAIEAYGRRHDGKQFILIDGVPVIVRTLKAFEIAERIREVVIAARQEDIPQMYALIQDYEITKVKQIITGGETRPGERFPRDRAGG